MNRSIGIYFLYHIFLFRINSCCHFCWGPILLWQLLKTGWVSFTNKASKSWTGCDQCYLYQDRIKPYALFFKLWAGSKPLSRQIQSCANDMVGFVGEKWQSGRRDYEGRAVIRDLEHTGWFQRSLRGRIGVHIPSLFRKSVISAASLSTFSFTLYLAFRSTS